MKVKLIALISLVLFCNSIYATERVQKDVPVPLFGITVDDSWTGPEKLQQIVDAIKAMPVKPTVRIVMSSKIKPKDYVIIFKTIHEVAYVMGQPVDSYYMNGYKTVEEYLNRFRDSYQYLSNYVDIWEIANEINGEGWIGDDRQFNSDKMYAAYKFINENNAKTAVISYEVAPGDQEMSMLEWLKVYVPSDMKIGLDYLLVSYYEDDHHGFQPDWQNVFKELQTMFPNTKVGMGECGNTAKDATTGSKIKMVTHYYTMPKYVINYVGGYFWWTWVQDCVPHKGNDIWKTINNGMILGKKNFDGSALMQ